MNEERRPDPWERLPNETSLAYEAFRTFRDLGPLRSFEGMQISRTSAWRWSSVNRWSERAQAWDAEAHRLEDARRLEQIRSMDDVHGRAARALITVGLRRLADIGPLTPSQAARFIDLGTRLERATLLGDHLAAPAAPVAVVDDDELSPLERIARELAGTA